MKRAFTLIEALIVVAIVALIAALLWPVFARQPPSPGASCRSNLKQIGLGFMQYVQDYDDKYPSTRITPSTGWADVAQPYIKSTQLFQCPSGQSISSTYSSDYFYNRRLSLATLDKVKQPALTVMLGDGDDNAPTWNSWTQLPADAATNSNSPSQRHIGSANYCFADGHVKAIAPARISSTLASPTSRPTFAVR